MMASFSERLSAWAEGTGLDRAISLGLGAPSWTVLAIALWLTPDARGFGTHQQLGFSTCTFMKLTDQPCPMCGMTTCFTHMAHLEPLSALAAQPFGVVLFSITASFAAIALVEGISPRGRWRRLWRWIAPRENRIAAGLIAGLLAGWVYKLIQMSGVL